MLLGVGEGTGHQQPTLTYIYFNSASTMGHYRTIITAGVSNI